MIAKRHDTNSVWPYSESVSDTGAASCLEEFQDLRVTDEGIFAEKWGKECADVLDYVPDWEKETSSSLLSTEDMNKPPFFLK